MQVCVSMVLGAGLPAAQARIRKRTTLGTRGHLVRRHAEGTARVVASRREGGSDAPLSAREVIWCGDTPKGPRVSWPLDGKAELRTSRSPASAPIARPAPPRRRHSRLVARRQSSAKLFAARASKAGAVARDPSQGLVSTRAHPCRARDPRASGCPPTTLGGLRSRHPPGATPAAGPTVSRPAPSPRPGRPPTPRRRRAR